MKNVTIRWRILLSFAVILGLMTIMAGVAYTRLMQIEQQALAIEEDSLPGLNQSHQILAEQLANHAATHDHIATSDTGQKQKLQSEILARRVRMDGLVMQYGAGTHTPADQQLLQAYVSTLER